MRFPFLLFEIHDEKRGAERIHMKQVTTLSEEDNRGPRRLIVSVILALVVMLFINGFIGSMGGAPAFLAFSFIFYWVRSRAVTEKEQPDREKKSLTALLCGYALGYLLLWGFLRVLMTISRVTGWGNLKGTSAVVFVRELLATPFWEKSAYFLAFVLMFLFVLSLFPLTVIRKKGRWILYALVDGAAFATVSLGIGFLCEKSVKEEWGIRPTCLIESFLQCGSITPQQEAAAFVAAAVFLAAVICFVFLFSLSCRRREQKEEAKILDISHRKRILAALVAAGVGLFAAAVVAVVVLFMPADETNGYERVAEFLTEDKKMGPVEYGGRVYVPVKQNLQVDENWVPRGYLAEPGQDCSTRFYLMTAASLLYTDGKGGAEQLQVTGDTVAVYELAETAAEHANGNTVCVLWDEDWEKESAYSHEPTGYTVCSRDLLEGLRMQFPRVTCRAQDFAEYDAIFTIRSYETAEELRSDETVMGQWEGCILVKDGKFYFGSYENQITGICLEELKNVIGGNKK